MFFEAAIRLLITVVTLSRRSWRVSRRERLTRVRVVEGAIDGFGGWDAWTDAAIHKHGEQIRMNGIDKCKGEKRQSNKAHHCVKWRGRST